MPGHEHGGKTKAGFPPRPQPWKDRRRRDFPISTAPTMRPDGKWKSKGRISTFHPAQSAISQKTKEVRQPVASLPAHFGMRKCCGRFGGGRSALR
jgi:hypothetical protein